MEGRWVAYFEVVAGRAFRTCRVDREQCRQDHLPSRVGVEVPCPAPSILEVEDPSSFLLPDLLERDRVSYPVRDLPVPSSFPEEEDHRTSCPLVLPLVPCHRQASCRHHPVPWADQIVLRREEDPCPSPWLLRVEGHPCRVPLVLPADHLTLDRLRVRPTLAIPPEGGQLRSRHFVLAPCIRAMHFHPMVIQSDTPLEGKY
mmetsp:Transcript_5617/g.12777  ORF Transcript_5617/g.12777 Transcript_5617/m.12777 type:complete len:201 (+) Transcript_5617:3329-3931(+)